MTPTTWTSFFFFLYFLLPGLFLDYLSRRYQPSSKESTLKELSRVILGSMVFTTFGFTILSLFRLWNPNWFMDVGAYFANPENYFLSHYVLIFWTLVAEEIIALTGVWLFDNFRVAFKDPNFSGTHQWDVLFRNRSIRAFKPKRWVLAIVRFLNSELQKENVATRDGKSIAISVRPVALVTLLSGGEIVGYVDMYSVDESPSDREILLSPIEAGYQDYLPDRFRAIAEKNYNWGRMYLPAHAVESIAIVYFEIPKD